MALAWLHWGLSLIGSAMLVRHIVRQQPRVDFRLLVTAAYLGMGATWHAGMSGSVPLLMATPGHFLEATTGRVPLSATTFAPFNLALSLLVFAVMAGVVWWMHPPANQAVRVSSDGLDALERFEPPPAPPERSFAAWCDHTRVLPLALGAMGAAWLAWYVRTTGPQLTLDVLNFSFLMLAIVLHGRLSSVMAAGEQGSRLLAGVLLQFPLYAGMYGIIEGTGLARVLGDAIARSASADTLPLALYWYSSVLNYFVPSGGSKWAVEAPFIIDAAGRLGVGLDEVILAYAWGDMASNLIQPFWALPLLAAAPARLPRHHGLRGRVLRRGHRARLDGILAAATDALMRTDVHACRRARNRPRAAFAAGNPMLDYSTSARWGTRSFDAQSVRVARVARRDGERGHGVRQSRCRALCG